MLAISSASSRLLAPAAPKGPRAVDRQDPAAAAHGAEPEPRLADDRVSISREARDGTRPTGEVSANRGEAAERPAGEVDESTERGKAEEQEAAKAPGALTEEEKVMVSELQARDAHVRAHEAAHQSAGGGMVGAASYSYQTAPDGRSYAIGGEVPIRIESGRTPEETIQNAAQARAAALAPSDPSPADLAVAASASQMERDARVQLARRATAAYGAARNDGDEQRNPRTSRGDGERGVEAPGRSGVDVAA